MTLVFVQVPSISIVAGYSLFRVSAAFLNFRGKFYFSKHGSYFQRFLDIILVIYDTTPPAGESRMEDAVVAYLLC